MDLSVKLMCLICDGGVKVVKQASSEPNCRDGLGLKSTDRALKRGPHQSPETALKEI
jgi:hypothetical protein